VKVLAVLLLLAVPLPGAAQPETAARPDVKVGDRWLYHRVDPRDQKPRGTRDERVTFANAQAIHTVVAIYGAEGETDATYSSSWNGVSSFDGGVITPDSGSLHFPLHPGDRYPANFENRRPRRGSFHVVHERTASVIGWEDVVVPAGHFRALKIEIEGKFRRLDSGATGTTRTVFWYAPIAKRWVKSTYEDWSDGRRFDWYVDELIDYRVQ